MTHVIILAGGKGTRLNAEEANPKAILKLDGVPLIEWVLRTTLPICPMPTIVVGFGAHKVIAATQHRYHYIEQKTQLGTGHAVLCARDDLRNRSDIHNIIILYGDHPFVSATTLRHLARLREETNAVIALATVRVPNFLDEYSGFYHFGRIVRSGKGGMRIVEFKDANATIRDIQEVNPGYYCFDPHWLWNRIDTLREKNAAQEYYLTDLIGMAVGEHLRIDSFAIRDPHEGMGINTPNELSLTEAWIRGKNPGGA